MPQFRKRPTVVEAFQMTQEHYANCLTWPAWLLAAKSENTLAVNSVFRDGKVWRLSMADGQMTINRDDWIVTNEFGELFLYTPAVFKQTYEDIAPCSEPKVTTPDGKPMHGLAADRMKEFTTVALPVMEFIKKYYNPHAFAVVTASSAEVAVGALCIHQVDKCDDASTVTASSEVSPPADPGDAYSPAQVHDMLSRMQTFWSPAQVREFLRMYETSPPLVAPEPPASPSRPTLVTAFQVTSETKKRPSSWPEWVKRAIRSCTAVAGNLEGLTIDTTTGEVRTYDGDWIVRDDCERISVITPKAFEDKYGPAAISQLGDFYSTKTPTP